MHKLGEMILKRKWIFLFFLVLGAGSFLLIVRFQRVGQVAEVILRIQERKAGSETPLLLSQTKGLINPLVMEKVVLKLGRVRPEDSAMKVQQEIIALQKSVSSMSEGRSGIVHLFVRDKSGPAAVRTANTMAEIFEEISLQEAGADTRQLQSYIERQKEHARQKIADLEEKVSRIEKDSGPRQLAEELGYEISVVREKRQNLLRVFTPKHPEVIKLEEQLAHLESDLAAVPRPEGDLSAVKQELVEAQQLFHGLAQQEDDAIFKLAEETGDVQIIRKAFTTKELRNTLRGKHWIMSLLTGIVAALISVTTSFRIFPEYR